MLYGNIKAAWSWIILYISPSSGSVWLRPQTHLGSLLRFPGHQGIYLVILPSAGQSEWSTIFAVAIIHSTIPVACFQSWLLTNILVPQQLLDLNQSLRVLIANKSFIKQKYDKICYCKWNGSIFHYFLTSSRQNVCSNNQILILKMLFSLYQTVSVDTSVPVFKPNLRLLILRLGSSLVLHKVTGWSWWRAEQHVLVPTLS